MYIKKIIISVILQSLFYATNLLASFDCQIDSETSLLKCDYTYINGANKNQTRQFYAQLPANFNPSQITPLVIALHGGTSNATVIADYSKLPTFATQFNFIALFPNAINEHWNDGRGLVDAIENDQEFLTKLVLELQTLLNIPDNLVFLMGMSNGAMMTIKMACDNPDLFQAYGVVSSTMSVSLFEQQCSQNSMKAASMAFIFGQKDPIMPVDKAGVIGKNRGTGVAFSKTLDYWLKRNQCDLTQWENNQKMALSAPIDINKFDLTRVFKTNSGICQNKTEIVFFDIENGGHRWPDPKVKVPFIPFVGRASKEIDATLELLIFFAQHID